MVVQWVLVDLTIVRATSILNRTILTFDILALKNDLSKNFTLSSSVCRITSLKFDVGSMAPVISSMTSICLLYQHCPPSVMPSLAVPDS